MHIGLIVSDDQKIEESTFIKVISPKDYKDDGSYTLFIGKNTVNTLLPDYTLRYLDKQIDERCFWTFSRYEKRNIFEDDVKKFRTFVFEKVFKQAKYKPIEVLQNDFSNTKALINTLSDDDMKYAYVDEKAIYIYYNKVIYGLSFDELNYIGIDEERILSFLRKYKNVRFIFSDKFITKDDKSVSGLDRKYIPYLYFITNSQHFQIK